MMPDLDKLFTQADKQLLREAFVGNETDSDEYGEGWPAKGFYWIQTTEADEKMTALALTWLQAWNGEGRGRYAGAAAARPLCELIFDRMWAAGETPYCSDLPDNEYALFSANELRVYLADLKESQA